MRALASFIMQGGRQATIVVATMAILSLLMPPLVIISVAAVCLLTLRNGYIDGLRVLIGATVATALIGYIVLGTSVVAFTYLLMMWLPAYLVSLVLRETRQLNLALECLVVLGMIAVVGVYSAIDDPAQLWAAGIHNALAALSEQQPLPISSEELQVGVELWSHYVTGLVVAGTLLSILMSLLLARWWQGLLFNAGGFDEEFRSFRLLPRDGVLFIALMVIAVVFDGWPAELMWNLDIQLLLLFLIVGISVVHVVIKSKSSSGYLLFAFYVMVFFVPHLILPLIVIGLSDVWMNWRQRFITKT
ncbi:MAG: DUF2232 domain-containing protein [Cycloclasticus sp.]|mgnify:CR=1 FL=1|nr:hypothetical protein A9Q80_05575 [Cycloclasticus sp. 46_83_sub15_T18]